MLKIFHLCFYIFRDLIWCLLSVFPVPKGKLYERKLLETSSRQGKFSSRADICFEFSSEGEWEQVRPIAEKAISQGKLIEIVYCSPSVDSKIQFFHQQYPNQTRICCYPFLSPTFSKFNLRNWVTAKKMILCRYDFFPEVVDIGLRKDTQFILINASLKGKESFVNSQSSFKGHFYRTLFNQFNKIICANDIEKEKFSKILENKSILSQSFDFRISQIINRLKDKKHLLDKYTKMRELAQSHQYNLIIGSAWPEDLEILDDSQIVKRIEKGDMYIAIVPHSLNKTTLQVITSKIQSMGFETQIISESTDLNDLNAKKITIVTIKGILCELYSFFRDAYIGGGHGESIHSVSEPYLSGLRVFCGPKTDRSTEYDFIMSHSPESLKVVHDTADFAHLYFFRQNVQIDFNEMIYKNLEIEFNNCIDSIIN
ncbi:MAG: hypothetical protein H6622_04625 [Halobacteriovoraceae bacterium]|nr:hypothetical protein [Halobacteriovoraceae bacterium]